MGCAASKQKSHSDLRINLEGVNLDEPATRRITEYPFYASRLKQIDWKEIVAQGQDWVDDTFPPQTSSILDDSMMRSKRMKEWEQYEWRRPEDVYGEEGFVVYDQIGPNDILQGKCGDCYFLSSLSSLAEKQERIKRIFLTKEVNDAGCYAVSLFINGERKTVVVDDYFPYDTYKDQWAFSRPSQGNEIWVLILEKAWAKIFGSYQRIESGTTGEALMPLTGCPTEILIHDDEPNKDHLWQMILAADQQGYPMATAVASQMEGEEQLSRSDMKSVGLVDAHAYSLIAAKVIKLDNAKTERILQVRNPWGKKEWKGDWSDGAAQWTELTKSQVDYKDADDGCFWISFADYDKFFYITTICYFRDEFVDSTICDQHEAGDFGIVKVHNPVDYAQPVIFTIDQVNARFADETMKGSYQYAGVKMTISKVVENKPGGKQQVFLDGSYQASATISKPFRNGLPKGDYLIVYRAEFTEEHPMHKLVLSVYADDPLEMKRISTENYTEDMLETLDYALYDRMDDPHKEYSIPI